MKHEFNGSSPFGSVGEDIMRWLDLLYEAVVNGFPGGSGASEDSTPRDDKRERSLDSKIDALIFWFTLAAACTGFVTGVPGLIALPLTIPADVTITLAIQLRLATSIASMCGYNPRDDQVRAFCYVCLCGARASNVFKDAGIKAGTRFAEQGAERVSGETLAKINTAAVSRLMAKLGLTGAVDLRKAVPFVSGAIGAAFDGTTTAIVGKAAKSTFYDPSKEKSRNDH